MIEEVEANMGIALRENTREAVTQVGVLIEDDADADMGLLVHGDSVQGYSVINPPACNS